MTKSLDIFGTIGIEKGEDEKFHGVFVDAKTGEKHMDPEPTVDPFLPVDEQLKQFAEKLKDRPEIKLTPLADVQMPESKK